MIDYLKTLEPLMLVGTVFYIAHVGVLMFLTLVKRKDFWHAVTGEDERLDPIDLVKLVWLCLFPVVVLADLFLDFNLDKIAWASLDAILFFVILRDLGIKYFDNKIPGNNKDDGGKTS